MKKIVAASFVLATLLSSFTAQAEERAVVSDNRVNVRAQAKLYSEVVTQLKKGDQVTVLERLSVQNPKPGEPTNWAKIKLPPNTTVWVYAPMVKDGVVSGSRLNLRAGPGENYSVLGRVEKGSKITELRTVEDWMEIEPPTEAYAFVDARLLKAADGTEVASKEDEGSAKAIEPSATSKEPATAAAASTPAAVAEPKETVAPAIQEEAKLQTSIVSNEGANVARTTDIAEAKTGAKAQPSTTAPSSIASTATAIPPIQRQAPLQQPAATTPDLSLHLPKTAPEPEQQVSAPERRIVRREGIIKGTVSIQAPTYFELEHAVSGKALNYLHAEKSGISLKDLKNKKVVITGEEYVDPRWPKTPVIEIETLEPAP